MITFIRFCLILLTPVFYIGSRLRNCLFDNGVFTSSKARVKVVSIGNITVGGSGKTPLVIYVSQLLKESGLKPGILSRGYGRASKGYVLVSKGEQIIADVESAGDEIIQTSLETKLPAAVCEKRLIGAEKLSNDADIDVIVLDDGFQHRWISRDFDLLVFEQRFFTERKKVDRMYLPTGNLRESLKGVKRADAIVLNRKFNTFRELPIKYKNLFEGKKVFNAHYKIHGYIDVKTGKFYNIEEFYGQKSLIVCGIANPDSFYKALGSVDVNTEHRLTFRDHEAYTEKDVQKIRKAFYSTNANSVITTQKDAVKFIKFSKELDDIDIYYLKISIEFDDKESFKNYLINKIS